MIQEYLNKFFPNLSVNIINHNDINHYTYEIKFYGKILSYYSDITDDLIQIKKNDLIINCQNCSYLIFETLLFRINHNYSITSYDMLYLENLTDDQLLRFMNLFLITSEDNQYLAYRKSNDISYLRMIIYTDCLSVIGR